MKSTIIYLLIACILSAPVAVLSQRPVAPAKAPVTTPSAQTTQAPTKLEPSRKSGFLSTAWKTGTLPPPMRPAHTEFEEKEGIVFAMLAQQGKAAAYVKAINAGDENSLPALLGAMLQAGYGITTSGGEPMRWSGKQGMNIPDYEIAAMAKTYGQGQTVSLKSFVKGLPKPSRCFATCRLKTCCFTVFAMASGARFPRSSFGRI